MQRAHRLVSIVFVDHEAHVNFRRALRDHAHVDVPNRTEDTRGHPVLPANILTHHADQCLAAFVFHIGQLAEVRGNLRDLLIRIDGKGTLTSEVETISTAHLCLSKTSKMARI